jgi:hemerythrin-like domain-containing protein
MRATQILMQEHRVIEQVLDCLEKMTRQVEAGEDLDLQSADQAIDFFRNFADRCHHGKEEDCLFPLLEERGFSRAEGPTGVMLHEHEEGRRHVRGMADASSAMSDGGSSAASDFVLHARAFVSLLREHIHKEDHCLFEMTDQTLSAQDQRELLQSFDTVEHDELGPGTHEKYLAVAAKLAQQYDVIDRVSGDSKGESCCGHH